MELDLGNPKIETLERNSPEITKRSEEKAGFVSEVTKEEVTKETEKKVSEIKEEILEKGKEEGGEGKEKRKEELEVVTGEGAKEKVERLKTNEQIRQRIKEKREEINQLKNQIEFLNELRKEIADRIANSIITGKKFVSRELLGKLKSGEINVEEIKYILKKEENASYSMFDKAIDIVNKIDWAKLKHRRRERLAEGELKQLESKLSKYA